MRLDFLYCGLYGTHCRRTSIVLKFTQGHAYQSRVNAFVTGQPLRLEPSTRVSQCTHYYILANIEVVSLLHQWRAQSPIHRYTFIVSGDQLTIVPQLKLQVCRTCDQP